jgi:hypothetical protein
MSWVATAIATSAALGYAGAKKQASAAERAGRGQAAAAREQMQFQRELADRLNLQQGPYRQAGYGALGRLNELLGLGPLQDPYSIARYEQGQQMLMDEGRYTPTYSDARREAILRIGATGKRGTMMSAADIAALGESARPTRRGGAFTRGITPAMEAMAGEGDRRMIIGQREYRAAKEEQEQLDRLMQSQRDAQNYMRRQQGLPPLAPGEEPMMAGGGMGRSINSIRSERPVKNIPGQPSPMDDRPRGMIGEVEGTYLGALPPGEPAPGQLRAGDLTRMFTAQDLETQLAPNYQFMLQQGLGAINQGANVGGGGSNITRGAIKFAQDYARNAYQDALNNYRLQQGDIYNRLAGIANTGQQAQQNAASTAAQMGSNISQLGIGAAQAQAAGQVGAANAMAGGLGNIASMLGTYGILRGTGNTGNTGSTGGGNVAAATAAPTGFYPTSAPIGTVRGTTYVTGPSGGYVGDINTGGFNVA